MRESQLVVISTISIDGNVVLDDSLHIYIYIYMYIFAPYYCSYCSYCFCSFCRSYCYCSYCY